jgi:hypothetical protein
VKTLVEILMATHHWPVPQSDTDDEVVAGIVGAVQEWLSAMAQDGQVPANRDLRDEYAFLIREASKGLDRDVAAP